MATASQLNATMGTIISTNSISPRAVFSAVFLVFSVWKDTPISSLVSKLSA